MQQKIECNLIQYRESHNNGKLHVHKINMHMIHYSFCFMHENIKIWVTLVTHECVCKTFLRERNTNGKILRSILMQAFLCLCHHAYHTFILIKSPSFSSTITNHEPLCSLLTYLHNFMFFYDRQKQSFHKKKSFFFVSTSEDDNVEIQRFQTSPLIISSPKYQNETLV